MWHEINTLIHNSIGTTFQTYNVYTWSKSRRVNQDPNLLLLCVHTTWKNDWNLCHLHCFSAIFFSNSDWNGAPVISYIQAAAETKGNIHQKCCDQNHWKYQTNSNYLIKTKVQLIWQSKAKPALLTRRWMSRSWTLDPDELLGRKCVAQIRLFDYCWIKRVLIIYAWVKLLGILPKHIWLSSRSNVYCIWYVKCTWTNSFC